MLAVRAATDDGDRSRSSSTARRSTPSAAARSATPARSPPTTGAAEVLDTTLRAARPAPPHRPRIVEGDDHRGPDGDGRRSTSTGATPSAATTPAPTCCTGRCARCSASTSSRPGSLVGARPAALRLQPLRARSPPTQIAEIERPRQRRDRSPTRRCAHYETTKDEAEALGAIAFFGDKYGDIVRVLEAGATRSSCAAAPTCTRHRRHRPDQDRQRGLDRLEPAPHRGRHRRGQRARCCSATRRWSPTRRGCVGVAGRRPARRRAATPRRDQGAPRRDQGAARPAAPRAAPPSSRPSPTTAWSSPRSTASTPGDLRDLAIAVRQQPGIRAVVLGGETDTGGVVARRRGRARQRASGRRRPDPGRRARPSAAAAAARATSPRPAARTRAASTRRCGSPRSPPPSSDDPGSFWPRPPNEPRFVRPRPQTNRGRS